jgi:hypothetical protein
LEERALAAMKTLRENGVPITSTLLRDKLALDKESGHVGHSWHQIKKVKFSRGNVDFYIFLTYLPVVGEHKISQFEKSF